MPANHIIKVVVTKEQKEKIRQHAHDLGYITLSAFLRDLGLNSDFHYKFTQLYNKLVKHESTGMDN